MEFRFFGAIVSIWILVPTVFLIWTFVLLLVKRIFFRAIKRFTAKTQTQFDDILVKALDLPVSLIIFASAIELISRLFPTLINQFGHYADIIFKFVAIIALTIFAERFSVGMINEYSTRVDILRTSGGVAKGFVRFVFIALGLLVVLESFGVSVTPIIASLGIGSLAVALALQPTLENFFSGIQIVVDKPIQLGQFVRLDTGEEGYIHKIGWRSTWIRLPQNNVVVIPNKTLVNAQIINYHYPDREVIFPVQLGVHYNSDLDKVENIAIEVAKQTLQTVPGGVKSFDPVVRFHTFADSSINFSVALRVEDFDYLNPMKHEFIKRIHKRFNQEGIVIPYPIRAINYSQEKAV